MTKVFTKNELKSVLLELLELMHGGEQVELDTIIQIDIVEHKVNAQVNELVELEEQRRVQQIDHIRQVDLDLARVDVVEQPLHRPRRDVLDVDLAEAALLQVAREHCAKVAARGAQDHLVARELHALHIDRDVREEVLVAELE